MQDIFIFDMIPSLWQIYYRGRKNGYISGENVTVEMMDIQYKRKYIEILRYTFLKTHPTHTHTINQGIGQVSS